MRERAATESAGKDGAGPPRAMLGRALRRWIAGFALLLLLLAGMVLAALIGSDAVDGEMLSERLGDLGDAGPLWGPVIVIVLMVLHSFVPFPAELVALAAGAAFGTLAGTAMVWTGAMLGAATAFAIARWLGRPAVERLLARRWRMALDDWTRDQGALTLLISRFIPVIAFNLINYAAGLTRVGWWTFLWTTGLGILPLTALMCHLGARMAVLSWPALLAVSAGGILLIVALHRLAVQRGWVPGHGHGHGHGEER